MHQGERLPAGDVNLDQARRYASSQLRALPKRLQALDAVDAESAYPVRVSSQVHADTEALRADLQTRLS